MPRIKQTEKSYFCYMTENRRLQAEKIISVIILVLLSAIYIACICARAKAAASPKPDFTVVIDAGHGGIDGGVSGIKSGVKESELNLDISRKLKTVFEKSGAKAVLTRKTEAGLYGIFSKGFKKRDMKKRMEIAERASPDVFVSIHLNYYSSSSRRGAQVFYKIGSEKSEKLAISVQNQLNALQNKNYAPLPGDFYVLNESSGEAILCECGFLSNEEDEAMLLTDEYRQKIAETIFIGIETYRYGLATGMN